MSADREVSLRAVLMQGAQAEQVARHVEHGAGSLGERWEYGVWQQTAVDRWSAARLELGRRAFRELYPLRRQA